MSWGPMLTMAPAIDLAVSPNSNLAFHRSHSTPDLLLSGGTKLKHYDHDLGSSTTTSIPISALRTISRSPLDQRTLSLKSLPSLPAFDVPSLDFEFDFGTDLHESLRFEPADKVDKARPKTTTNEKTVVEVRTSPTPVVPAVVDATVKKEKSTSSSRRKSMIDRHRSWLPSSKSSSDVRATIRQVDDDNSGASNIPIAKNRKGAFVAERKAIVAETEVVPPVPPVPPIPSIPPTPPPIKPIERSRTVESIAGLAKRSWITKSRSPSPSPKKKESRTAGRQRAESNASASSGSKITKTKAKFEAGPAPAGAEFGLASGPASDVAVDAAHTLGSGLVLSRPLEGIQPRSSSTDSLSSSSTGRALNRASSYLTKFKRPQSVFVKSHSSLSLSATASSPDILFHKAVEDAEESDLSTNERNNSRSSNNTAWSESTSHLPTTVVSSFTSALTSTITLIPNPSTTTTTEKKGNSLDIDVGNKHRNSSHTTSSEHTDSTSAASENASSQATNETTITMPHPTSRDPLWSLFKDLDGEYAKFQNKTQTAAKMQAVKSVLLPFLHSTAGHESNSNRALLTPEDVDRRAVILNKWWNGLLEMLEAGQSAFGGRAMFGGSHINPNLAYSSSHVPMQPVAGVDRPAVLEATTMLMMRPEWRLSTSYFQPLPERSPDERVRARSGSESSIGTGEWGASGGIIVETAEHNVRTMFISNLTTQMALAVDKMSMRHAPTSLVNWSGKACAYAFFFCPGVAEVLVRLWGLRPDVVRRAAETLGLPRRSRGESEDLVALFPPNLGGLGWTSAKTIMDRMKIPAKLPLLQAKINWHGPWVTRWRGADTDLFYIFAKYYHILAEEFTPPGLPLLEQARAPAFVLLHAQLLANLDGTIHRNTAVDAAFPMTDPVLGNDATMGMAIPTMPLQSSNAFMGMTENRLILLLKDMLGDNTVGVAPSVKMTYAEAFMRMMKSATKATRQHEPQSINMLCDFLEEALPVYHTFQTELSNNHAAEQEYASTLGPTGQADVVDWPFWFDVLQKILSSVSTLAEIRLLSLVYTLWDMLVLDPARKRQICIDWLLAPAIFDNYFNNWCPMIRAYYMRLLCWRICRDSGSASELDEDIFCLAAQRLKTAYSHYLWLKEDAQKSARLPPSTAPCPPTPQKRFMIIRTELQNAAPGLYVGFDQFPTFSPPQSGAYGTSALTAALDATSLADNSSASSSSPSKKEKKSMLSKVLNWTASTSTPSSPFRRNASETDLERLRAETARSRTASPPKPPTTADSASSTGSALLLDDIQYQFRFTLTWANAATLASMRMDRVIGKPRLPAAAWGRVLGRMGGFEAVIERGHIDSGIDLRRDAESLSPELAGGGLPRRISGAGEQPGLIAEARNARPLDAETAPSRSSHSRNNSTSSDKAGPSSVQLVASTAVPNRQPSPLSHLSIIQPLRPTGAYATNATYVGRALAEWSIVVNEHNSFVDRRRDEGVFDLSDIEVPQLGVEGISGNAGAQSRMTGRA